MVGCGVRAAALVFEMAEERGFSKRDRGNPNQREEGAQRRPGRKRKGKRKEGRTGDRTAGVKERGEGQRRPVGWGDGRVRGGTRGKPVERE
jgi:hypothetical protein